MIRALLSLLFIVLLASMLGCATAPEKDIRTVIQVKEVQVPVREKCRVEIPDEPAWAVLEIDVGVDHLTKSQAVLADLEQSRDYIQKLKTNARKCE